MVELRKLRDLKLSNTVEGRPDHLSAGSGLVRHGDYIYVIGDDELDLAIFSLRDPGPGELVRLFEGELPTEDKVRHRYKPDLEALTTLPPVRFCPHGALLALGSGSGESRDRGFAWSLGEDGGLRGFPRVVDLSDLYEFLERHVVEDLNIEGVAVAGDRLALFQRGNPEGGGANLVVHLSLDKVMNQLTSDFAIESSELYEIREFDLGGAGGADFAFSDADSLPDGRLAFSASAEGEDGECRGSIVGVIGPDGELEQAERVDNESIKIEGIDAVLHDGSIDLLIVSDADATDVPSPLMSATLPARTHSEPKVGSSGEERPTPAGA
jgi:hypothetical protein